MSLTLMAYAIVVLSALYFSAGIAFCVFMLIKGIERMDPNAKSTGIGFKLLIIPGLVAFWPVLWKKWKRSGFDT